MQWLCQERWRRNIFTKIEEFWHCLIVLFILFIIHQQVALQSYLTSIPLPAFACLLSHATIIKTRLKSLSPSELSLNFTCSSIFSPRINIRCIGETWCSCCFNCALNWAIMVKQYSRKCPSSPFRVNVNCTRRIRHATKTELMRSKRAPQQLVAACRTCVRRNLATLQPCPLSSQ